MKLNMTYLGFKELWVDEFSVHPSYQRKGIGTKMIEFIRTQLKEETEKISYQIGNRDVKSYCFLAIIFM